MVTAVALKSASENENDQQAGSCFGGWRQTRAMQNLHTDVAALVDLWLLECDA